MKILKVDLNATGKNVIRFELPETIDLKKISTTNFDISKPMVFETLKGALILPPAIWTNSILTITEE